MFEGEDAQRILTTALPGIPLRETNAKPADVAEVYRQAGRLCRRLHDLDVETRFGFIDENGRRVDVHGAPLGEVFDDPVSFVVHRYAGLLEKAQALDGLEPWQIALAQSALEAVHAFAEERPVPVNADYTPKNWLIDEQGQFVGIIDLENCGWGIPKDSLGRLLVDYFHMEARSLGHRRQHSGP